MIQMGVGMLISVVKTRLRKKEEEDKRKLPKRKRVQAENDQVRTGNCQI